MTSPILKGTESFKEISVKCMSLCTEIYILSSVVVYFSDTLPSNSPILIIMYHLEITLESYKLSKKSLWFYKLWLTILNLYETHK